MVAPTSIATIVPTKSGLRKPSSLTRDRLTHKIGKDGGPDQHCRNGKEPLERRRRNDVTISDGAQGGEGPVQGGDVLGEVALVQQAFLEGYKEVRISGAHHVQKMEWMTSLFLRTPSTGR
jgi:hypothetical protein